MIDRLIRGLLSAVRDLHDVWNFGRRGGSYRFKGVYPSYQAAVAALPPAALKGFDHQSVAEFFVETHFVFNPSDYPILFWLSRILEPGQMLFDFGGGVGQCFFIYQRFLRLPPRMCWRVCEVEALAQRGAQYAQEKHATDIQFTTQFEDAKDADVFLTTGVLHYIDEDLPVMLARLPRLPKHVLINRVPMHDREKTFYTIQHSEHSFAPNKVMNRDSFVRGMEKLGYEKVDQWYLPRQLRIPFHPECFLPSYSGFYFRAKGEPPRFA